ncbi:kinase [Oxyplasma meridianum]|uniref:Kinase n=1 Tax=Oxyplasma meridianum TaxID=3073602 RepID=A0AAX4NGK1_9ARCH
MVEKAVSYSPLRISFGGGGTDISPFPEKYGGSVVNTTIDRGVMAKYVPDQYGLEISSRDFLRSFVLNESPGSKDLLNKILGLFEMNGIIKGRVVLNGDVPPGSGLGSSSALITSLLNLIHYIKHEKRTWRELADEAFRLERDYFGVILGKQDPYAISLGGFKHMSFNRDIIDVTSLNQYSEFIEDIEKRTLLLYTGKTRESSNVLKEQVARSSQGDERTLINLKEMRKIADEMKLCASMGNSDRFIELINYGWEIKKNFGENVSNKTIDGIIEKGLSSGAQGAKLMGGGSQGFILMIAKKGEIENLQKEMMSFSDLVIRVNYDYEGIRIF